MSEKTGSARKVPAVAEPAKVTSRSEKRELSRALILGTAVRLFAERGFEGVRLDEIAQEAGVRRTLVLYYFASKEELWRAAGEQVSAAFNRALHRKYREARERSPADPLSDSLAASLEAFLEEPDFPRFLVREGGVKSPRLDWLIERFDYVDVDYGSPELRSMLKNTIARDVFFAILLSMTALGPLMDAWLSRVAERPESGLYPMSASSKDELVALMTRFISGLDVASETAV